MKRLQSLSYKTLFTILFLSLAGIIFFIRIGRPAQKVSAAWWDEMWHYRKAIQINNSGTNRTNIQFKLFTNYDLSSLVSAGKIQADLDDLRFTDINGNLLNYWIEDATNNSTDIWIVLNSLPNSGTTVYLYYGNSSATSGQTIMGKTPNNPGITCKAIQLSGGSDGVYYIDPTGLEATDAYQTYCDMSGNGGGWTLLMKSEGNTTTFNYNASYWTTTNTLNPNDTEINHNTDAKFESFNSLIIDQIRATWPSTGHTMVETISTTTALSLFQTTVDLGPSMAQFDYTNFPYQTGYQSYGFNLTCAAANKVRWGWMFNNETTCSSNDCSAGIGLMTVYSTTNGGYVTCCSSKPNGGYPYRVRIWGRENNIVTPNVSFINTTPQSEESSTGPVAYWKFDEGTGTTAYDSSSNNNDGTFLSNPIWKNEDECITGKCLSFDNVDDGVSVNNNFTNLNDYSMCAWINPKGNHKNYTGTIISSGDWNTNHWAFGINQSNTAIQTRRADGVNFFTWNYNFSINQWSYVCITRSNTIINAYVNGKQTGSTYTGTTGNVISNAANTTIGRETYAGGYFAFNGLIDEPKIYPYARTADQIKQDYNSRGTASSQGSSVNLGSNKSSNSLSDGLVGYWKMDEGVGTTTLDSSGNNNTGTLSGAGWTSGRYGVGSSYNGSGGYITTSSVKFLSLIGNPYSIGFWIQDDTSSSILNSAFHRIISFANGTTNIQVGLANDIGPSGNRIFYLQESSSAGSAKVVTTAVTNGWHYVVATSDGFGRYHLYLDGNLADNGNTTSSISSVYTANTGNLYMGQRGDGGHINGKLDEVRIYNRALSPAEVSSLYNYAPGPVGYWDFNDGSGITVKDISGNNNTGTWSGTGSHWTQGKIGGGGNFNGSSDYLNLGTFTNLDFSKNFTASAWIKSSNKTSSRIFLGKYNGTGSDYWFGFSAGKLHAQSGCDASNEQSSDGSWHYITNTCLNGTSYLYDNGILIDTGICIASNPSGNLKIGSFGDSGGFYWDGLIDEVKIYNYARTQKQIIEDMNAGAPATSAKSMVAYYKFDEGNGVTVKNQVNNNYTLTSSGQIHPTVENNGKINKSLYFHGIGSTNRSYMYTTPINIGNSGTLSFSFWVNPDSSQSGDGTIIRNGVGMDQNYKILIGSPSSNKYKIFIQRYNGTWESTSTNNYLLSSSEWSHVSIVLTESLSWKFYLNGKYIETISIGGTVPNSTSYLAIGGHGGTISQYLNGYLDEIKIYNYALTDEEIKQDYNAGSAIQFGSTSQSIGGTTTSLEYCIPGDTSPCSAPIAEWKMDEGVGTSITDTSGNSNTGTITGATWNQGKIGKGLKFNGSNNYVEVPSTPNATGTFTISTWVKAINGSSSDGYGYIIHRGSDYSIGGSVYFLGINPAGNYVGAVNGNHLNGDTGIAANENIWRFLTLSYDGNTQKVYVDGQLKSSYSLGAITNTTTGNKIGFGGTSLYLNYRNIKGQMDQVRVYNYARTPAQIAYDYNKGGPVGWWKFDECQGNIAYDWSGTGNTGTIVVGASGTQNSLGTCAVGTSAAWTNGASGKINSSLNFDGVDDKVALNPITNYLSGSFSYSAWIKLDTNVGAAVKNAISSEVSSYSNYWSVIGTYLNKWNFALYEGSNNPIAFSNDNFELNTWTHIVGVRDITTDKIYIYKNGVLQGNGTTDTTTSIPAYSAFNIGGQVNVANRYFPGQIDDVRIYNYALTSEQVKQVYNGGAVNFR